MRVDNTDIPIPQKFCETKRQEQINAGLLIHGNHLNAGLFGKDREIAGDCQADDQGPPFFAIQMRRQVQSHALHAADFKAVYDLRYADWLFHQTPLSF